jgi:predicted negative regulator of RcsB-dependent stress response
MMAKNRVTRKQLLKEPDEFLTLSARLLEFAVKNKRQMIWVGIGCLILVIAVAGFRYHSARSESHSFALLSQTMVKFANLSQEKGPATGFLEVEGDFKNLIDNYGGTTGGKLARVMYADLSAQGGYPDTAIPLYKKALADFEGEPRVKHKILLSLAYALEAKREYKAAADYLETLAADKGAVGAGEATYNLGRIYALMGEAQKSQAMYEKLLSDYPDNMYADLVRSKLAV